MIFKGPLIFAFDCEIDILDLLKSKYTVSESVSFNCSPKNGTPPSVPPPGTKVRNSDLKKEVTWSIIYYNIELLIITPKFYHLIL